jgi:hypothetical protein
MKTAGKWLALELGAFDLGPEAGTDNGHEPETPTGASEPPATGPLYQRAAMDGETVVTLATILGVTVREFARRYPS